MGKSKRKLKKRLNRSRQRKEGQVQGTNHHHLTPKSRHGKSTPRNLLRIDIQKHRCWHTLFKNKNISEVIEFLLRVRRLKQVQRR